MYEPRGFTNIDDHNDVVIKNINEDVLEDDHLYILGDLMLNDNEKAVELLKQIKCKNIHVILGNHDTDTRVDLYKELGYDVKYADIVKYTGYSFYISHYPTKVGNYDDKDKKSKFYNLCGHTHTQDKYLDFRDCRAYHVELDAHNNRPVSANKIINDIKYYNIQNIV